MDRCCFIKGMLILDDKVGSSFYFYFYSFSVLVNLIEKQLGDSNNVSCLLNFTIALDFSSLGVRACVRVWYGF